MRIIACFGSLGKQVNSDTEVLELRTIKAYRSQFNRHEVVYLEEVPNSNNNKKSESRFNEISPNKFTQKLNEAKTLVREFINGKTQLRIEWSKDQDETFTQTILAEIAKSNSVKELDLSYSMLNNPVEVLRLLGQLPLEKLSLCGNILSAKQGALASSISEFKSLKSLSISECSLRYELACVLNGLQNMQSLEQISISGNEPNDPEQWVYNVGMEAYNKSVEHAIGNLTSLKELRASKEIQEKFPQLVSDDLNANEQQELAGNDIVAFDDAVTVSG